MSACNTCGNTSSLPCGCKDIALTMSCANHIGLNCPPNINQCASIECAECIQVCNGEDAWVAAPGDNTTYPIWWQQGWSIAQFMQSLAMVQAMGQTSVYGYFPFFTATNVTLTSVSLAWSWFVQQNIYPANGFSIEYSENSGGDWIPITIVPLTQTTYTVTSANTPLTPGVQYAFRIRTVDANGDYTVTADQSVVLLVTIPN